MSLKNNKYFILLFGFTFSLLLTGKSNYAQKTDVLILINNDVITGEIKKLEHGMLVYKTDDVGTLQVKWDKVIGLKSDDYFEFETAEGKTFFGTLLASQEHGMLKISPHAVASFMLDMQDIIRITPIENRFWNRLDGSISIGFNYTKASDIAQLNYNANTTYRTRKISNEIILDGNTTYGVTMEDEGREITLREDFSDIFTRFLKHKWYVQAYVATQKNTELGIDRRILLGFGGGNYLIQSNRHALGALIGLVGIREWLAGENPNQSNLEGLINLSYSLFKYDTPKSDISFTGSFFPGLTDWGRVRAEVNIKIKQEIIKDFFFSLSFYESYDNKPGENASENDWGIVTSIGYSW